MAHKGCLHGMIPPKSCAYCFPQGGRKLGIRHIAPPPNYGDIYDDRNVDGDTAVLREDEDGDLDDDIEPAEAAFAPRTPKAKGALPAWDLRVSDAIPDIPLTPKIPKPSARLRSVTVEEQEKRKKRGVLVLGDGPITISLALASRRSNGKSTRQIAEGLSVSDACIFQYLSLLKLIPKLQAMMDPAIPEATRLHLTLAVALASLPPHLQEECAQEVLGNGWTVNKAAQRIRMRAQQERAKAKLSRPAQ